MKMEIAIPAAKVLPLNVSKFFQAFFLSQVVRKAPMIITNLKIPQSPLLLTLLNTCLYVEVKLSLLHLF